MLLEHAKFSNLGSTDPICSFNKTKVLQATELAMVIKRAASAMGEDASRYSCHSLRSGGATALLAAGVDSTTIKLHGRWASDTFQRYTRYSEAIGASLSAKMSSVKKSRSL